MTKSLAEELAEAEDKVARLKRRLAAEDCNKVGCNMVHIGGRNAGCCDSCVCSVPVYECSKCGDSDYGDNEEANDKRAHCKRMGEADSVGG